MSSQYEQDIVATYCRNRKLIRPDTNIKHALKWIFYYEICVVVISMLLFILLNRLGISFPLFSKKFIFLFYLVSFLLFVVCLRKVLVLGVELYQHYAPEDVRRRCMMMPSCSEYALLALRKHGVIIGLIKIYVRLTKKCKGGVYKIDYP